MSSANFKINPRFDEQLFEQALAEQVVSSAGRKVVAAAKSNASAVGSGSMAAYIQGTFARGRRGRPHFYVSMSDNTSPNKPGSAIAIEFGTGDTPAHAILRRAIESAR